MSIDAIRHRYRFAFYCSGHGYGHATRVSALTSELLHAGHEVHIVTNAPTQPFSAVLPPSEIPSPELRRAAPVPATTPLPSYAYYRRRNVDAGIVQPKAYDVDREGTYRLLKNFMDQRPQTLAEEITWLKGQSIDCVLSDSTFLGCAAGHGARIPSVIVSNFTFDSCYSYLSLASLPSLTGEPLEPPISDSILSPLVEQSIADYACASLLLRLPGAIPIPGFDTDAPLPSGKWVNAHRTSFTAEIDALLSRPTSLIPATRPQGQPKARVIDVPLLVRPPSPKVHTPAFRQALLASMDVPEEQFEAKILLVSFGGQSIPRPRSRPPSPLSTPLLRQSSGFSAHSLEIPTDLNSKEAGLLPKGWIAIVCGLAGNNNEIRNDLPANFYASDKDVYVPDLTATADVVLGKLGYGTCSETISNHTPFVYGQLCSSSQFIYGTRTDHDYFYDRTFGVVPRPLFVEEFGLKRLMTSRGVALELDRQDFEAGRWEFHVLEAEARGAEAKARARREGFQDERAGQVIRDELEKFLTQSKLSAVEDE
ncbi:BQ5605_C044g12179 [Microbotryum silenes-dioicae]|uniref:BQ5605_C044g12179 protein n=1 Tax=Microbotryum silenes-dioicae TaxID=796604 RepID=A0A2X0PPV2_9BASI|nr:BQ5605_C044g12179 [Microbotryum silenes-dioicae]